MTKTTELELDDMIIFGDSFEESHGEYLVVGIVDPTPGTKGAFYAEHRYYVLVYQGAGNMGGGEQLLLDRQGGEFAINATEDVADPWPNYRAFLCEQRHKDCRTVILKQVKEELNFHDALVDQAVEVDHLDGIIDVGLVVEITPGASGTGGLKIEVTASTFNGAIDENKPGLKYELNWSAGRWYVCGEDGQGPNDVEVRSFEE